MICGSCVYVYNVRSCDWTASGGRLHAPARTCNIRKHFFSRQGFHRHSDVLRVPSFARGDSAARLSFFCFSALTFFFSFCTFQRWTEEFIRSGFVSVFDCSVLITDCRPKWKQTPEVGYVELWYHLISVYQSGSG